LDQLLAPLKDQLSQEGFRGGLFGFFVSRVKQNLRILPFFISPSLICFGITQRMEFDVISGVVLVMDPQNKDFLMRCESNPALYTQCSIQWWESWSNEAMNVVAKLLLSEILEHIPVRFPPSLTAFTFFLPPPFLSPISNFVKKEQ
jgi:dynein heavy chain 2, cytosolic